MICLTEGGSDSWAQYCVGKDPAYPYFDANNGGLLIQMNDRRVSQYLNYYCIDCNSEQFTAGSCAFMSDYFPDHRRASYSDNTFLVEQIVACPFQSKTRAQARYLDSISFTRRDSLGWSDHAM